MSRARQASAITDSPIRRREHGGSFEDGGFDELQPMSLNFDCKYCILFGVTCSRIILFKIFDESGLFTIGYFK